ncbi:hypothetical protein BKA82DRAFT_32141 [Pisolithus tinctorius]|uniref:Uncharacterized protein n=1 Tax=Pisolithus tinctorius Marx 270 TaxID=870435 RepID=A0A0C3NQ09_PISTI|nr:hypothetical protein BKA82DRAFT_32141 [Pisolithus tinctorius]KIN97665.1 hypothetical protein M404DRAFT_32141 [Pisolithus tinctorius Marx 270]
MKLEAIAVANNVTFDHIKGLINMKTNYHHSHCAMLQNALVHTKSLEVNTDHPVGEKLPMAQLQELVKVNLEAHLLSQSEEELLIKKLQEYHELKMCGTHMNNTAMACNVNYMVDRITTFSTLAWRFPTPTWRFPTLAWRFPTPAWRFSQPTWRFSTLAWRFPIPVWRISQPIW